MCGQPQRAINQTEAEQLVLLAHQELPKDNRVVKNYCIDRCKSIRVGTGRGNSKRKILNTAVEICKFPLLRPLPDMKQYEILRFDCEKMNQSLADRGGKCNFGDFVFWGDTFFARKIFDSKPNICADVETDLTAEPKRRMAG